MEGYQFICDQAIWALLKRTGLDIPLAFCDGTTGFKVLFDKQLSSHTEDKSVLITGRQDSMWIFN